MLEQDPRARFAAALGVRLAELRARAELWSVAGMSYSREVKDREAARAVNPVVRFRSGLKGASE